MTEEERRRLSAIKRIPKEVMTACEDRIQRLRESVMAIEAEADRLIDFLNGESDEISNESLTLDEVANEYLEICDRACGGDSSVGIPPCPFFDFPDVDEDRPHPGVCKLERFLPPKDAKGG